MGAAFVLAMGSCAYDPNYAVGGAYSAGYGGGGAMYGEGYGYGYSGFSTTMFVGTGDPRWGYDPYCNAYYDYNRRCYYDPYLYGYYPMGYRPVLVVGVPHPYGYRHNFCPPPTHVRTVTLANYNNRASLYHNSSYSWAHSVHAGPVGNPRGPHTGNPSYSTGHNLNQAQGGYPGSHNLNTVNGVHGQSGQPLKYTGTTNPKYGHVTGNQGNAQLKTGGAQPQMRHVGPVGGPPAGKGQVQGKGQAQGKGKELKEGNAR